MPTVRLLHSSDLHLTYDHGPGDRLLYLRWVLDAAEREEADVVLLVGDLFDHVRQPEAFVEATRQVLEAANRRIVILPGNHDPLTPDSVYFRGGLAEAPNVSVLGVPTDDPLVLTEWDLSFWGRAHRDYGDMSPLRNPASRSARWHVALAHGHFLPERPGPNERFVGSWLFDRADLESTRADYVALGHWNLAQQVGGDTVCAYYSGSPDIAGTANLVVLDSASGTHVQRVPLGYADGA